MADDDLRANLPDGTVLRFPNGTDQSVIQRVVKYHLGIGEQSPAGLAASQAAAADTRPKSWGELLQQGLDPSAWWEAAKGALSMLPTSDPTEHPLDMLAGPAGPIIRSIGEYEGRQIPRVGASFADTNTSPIERAAQIAALAVPGTGDIGNTFAQNPARAIGQAAAFVGPQVLHAIPEMGEAAVTGLKTAGGAAKGAYDAATNPHKLLGAGALEYLNHVTGNPVPPGLLGAFLNGPGILRGAYRGGIDAFNATRPTVPAVAAPTSTIPPVVPAVARKAPAAINIPPVEPSAVDIPAGIDPKMWAKMSPDWQAQLRQKLAAPPAVNAPTSTIPPVGGPDLSHVPEHYQAHYVNQAETALRETSAKDNAIVAHLRSTGATPADIIKMSDADLAELQKKLGYRARSGSRSRSFDEFRSHIAAILGK